MKRTDLGRWGEDIVARILGYTRVPYSGAVWPHKQDLAKTVIRGINTGAGGIEKYPLKYVAQVKTTEGEEFLTQWQDLERHAKVERAEPRWFDVVKTPNEAFIFERRLRRVVRLGVGGEYP